jgi:16S rRNA (cytidine1402-2'-O)-methyltransferase
VTPGSHGTGRLVLVSTPIGNLGDLSPRAITTLAHADVVCSEDTRRTRALLSHAGITGVRLISLHGHNETARIDDLLARLAEGQTVAVVSDAGTPSVSDPGTRLVSAAAEAGVTVSVVPGPSAVLAALVVSGLPTDRFAFEGFLPRRGGPRRRRLEALASDDRTVVIYEAPSRVGATLADLVIVSAPERRVVVARELTKVHEEVWRGTVAEAVEAFTGRELRGEVVIVLAGAMAVAPTTTDEELTVALQRRLDAGGSVRDAAGQVALELGVARRRAYDAALSLRRNVGG